MSILSILPAVAGTAANTGTTNLSPSYGMTADQRRLEFQQLAASLQSGDLSGAQTAYANLMGSAASSSSATSGTSALPWWMKNSSTLTQEFQTIGNDLSSGNLSGAQADFTQFQTDAKAASSQMQASGGAGGLQGHHRHHHHQQQPPQDGNVGAAAGQTTSATTPVSNPLLSLLSSASLSGFSNTLATSGGGLAAPFSLFS